MKLFKVFVENKLETVLIFIFLMYHKRGFPGSYVCRRFGLPNSNIGNSLTQIVLGSQNTTDYSFSI